MLCGPGFYQPTRDAKIQAAEISIQALPAALPTDPWASTFHIWHNDFHLENIFVREDNPAEITAIIDWQSPRIAPLFDHTLLPGYLDHDGPTIKGTELPANPELPEDASEGDRAAAWAQYYDQTVTLGFKNRLKKAMPLVFEVLTWQESDAASILHGCRSVFTNSETLCLASFLTMHDSPFQFSAEEKAKIEADMQKTWESVNAMNAMMEAMGHLAPERGLVRHEHYDDAKTLLRSFKAQAMEDFAQTEEDWRTWEESWPFDD